MWSYDLSQYEIIILNVNEEIVDTYTIYFIELKFYAKNHYFTKIQFITFHNLTLLPSRNGNYNLLLLHKIYYYGKAARLFKVNM